jgi:serine protease Do
MIITNRHVVSDNEAEYTVYTQDGKKYPAKVLAKDSVQDIAVLKIEGGEPFPTVKLGDSANIQIGQTVIAIGNALGEFNNTVSVGVISGLSRTITAGGRGVSETLENIIQTDAAINSGNSGGPLFNLKGEVIGVNTAMAGNAQNIGFAIPVNVAARDISQVKNTGKITYPFLGVNYVIVDDTLQKENGLPVNYGAWIEGTKESLAIVAGSSAEKAGLKYKDIILEFDGEKITKANTLSSVIMKRSPLDKVTLKVMRDGQILVLEAVLGERS